MQDPTATSSPWPTGRVAPRVDQLIRLDDDPRYRGSIHDDATAREKGFRAALVPGAFLYGHVSRLALDAWGADWVAHGWMTVRFRRPVYNGDTVVMLAGPPQEQNGRTEVTITMEGVGGEVVLTGAVGLPHTPPAPPALADWELLPPPVPRRAVTAGGMTPGLRGGTLAAPLTEADIRTSRSAFDETHAFYRDTRLAHSGCLMRLAMREVNTSFAFPSPVILTACEAQHFSPVAPGQIVAVSSVVTADTERNGRHSFESDEVLIADGRVAARFRRMQIYAMT